MRHLVLAVILLVVTAPAFAQKMAVVKGDAPIYIRAAVSETPLRVAAEGTRLQVMGEQGDWVQVEFQDPRWGRRVGWLQRTDLRIEHEALRPMDLSVPESTAVPATPGQAYADDPEPRAQEYYDPRVETANILRTHLVGHTGVTFATETATWPGLK